MSSDLHYPRPEEVLFVHDDIVERGADSKPGARDASIVESVMTTVSTGHLGQEPETVHETAVTLICLLVADYLFVNDNKRPSLNTAVMLHEMNGYALIYDEERIRWILKQMRSEYIQLRYGPAD